MLITLPYAALRAFESLVRLNGFSRAAEANESLGLHGCGLERARGLAELVELRTHPLEQILGDWEPAANCETR